jgi:hypothetical protein
MVLLALKNQSLPFGAEEGAFYEEKPIYGGNVQHCAGIRNHCWRL